MKRIISLLLASILCVGAFYSCDKNKNSVDTTENSSQTTSDKDTNKPENSNENSSDTGTENAATSIEDYNWIYSDDEVMFTINGLPVDFASFRHYVMYNKPVFDGGDESYWTEENQTEFFNLIKDEFKYYYSNVLLANEKDVKLSEEDTNYIKSQIDALKESTDGNGQASFEESLGEMFLTEEIYTDLVTYEFYIQELVESMVDKKEIDDYINKNYVTVQHVLISTDDEEGNALSEEAATEKLNLANDIYAKAVGGEDFRALIDQYGEDPGMTAQDSYTFTKGKMVIEFEEASFQLNVGEISEPVKSDFGYHIIKKLPLNKNATPIEDSTDYLNIVYELGYSEYSSEITEYMETVEVTDTDAFKAITIFNIGTLKNSEK